MVEGESAIDRLRERLEELPRDAVPSGATRNRCLSEGWFSDSLAWLLDPKGDHGLGVDFARAFVKRVARLRSAETGVRYRRRATTLRWGQGGRGATAGAFSFKNAAVVREYYLARLKPRQSRPVQRFCDLVFLDLDSRDGFFLVIENKLFTADHDDQLQEYRIAVEEKYQRAKVREYVFLTLEGQTPSSRRKGSVEHLHWVRMSWIEDVREVLRQALEVKGIADPAPQLHELLCVLRWLGRLVKIRRELDADVRSVRSAVTHGTAACLLEELTRLGQGKRGVWSRGPKRARRVTLVHSSRPAGVLSIDVLPGLTVAVQGQTGGRAEFEKLLVPFGAHPDQVFNLLDLAARDIYHHYFEKPELYLGSARRLRTAKSPAREAQESLFRFLHEHRYSLSVLLSL